MLLRPRISRHWASGLALSVFLSAAAVHAQPLPTAPFVLRPPPAPRTAPYTVEVELRDRWMHGRQRPLVVPFAERRSLAYIDSIVPAPEGGRTLVVRVEGTVRATVRLQAAETGRLRALDVRLDQRPVTGGMRMSAMDSTWLAHRRLFDGNRLALPGDRVWDIVPAALPPGARSGTRWADSVAASSEQDGMRQRWRGARVSTVIGDTVVDGRRLWIVRDSAHLRYEERLFERDRVVDALVPVERTATGVLVGWHLLDPALGLFRARRDTLTLAGEAVLHHPDGRSFRTPARYERTRSVALHEPAELERRRRAIRAAQDSGFGGMLMLPRDTVAQRVAAGDDAVFDSLASVVRQARAPATYDSAMRLLGTWRRRTAADAEAFAALQLAAGDTARAVATLLGLSPAASPITVERLELLLPIMRDPGAAFALGVDHGRLHESIVSALTLTPPVLQRDSSRWPCTPAACRLLAAQWDSAAEPPLRDVGLAVRATMDPAAWGDTVLARAAAGAPLLHGLSQLVRGVGATWPAASQLPMPAPDADWRAWSAWMNGVAPAYREQMERFQRGQPRDLVRFDPSHRSAIRFHAARTGRDVPGELQRSLAAASSDSARLVYASMLLGLGELTPDPDSVARRLRGTAPERRLAALELTRLFGDRVGPMELDEAVASPADEPTAVALLDTLLAMAITGAPAWPMLEPDPRGRSPVEQVVPNGRRPFVLAERLPDAVRELWASRAHLVTREGWQRERLQQGGVLVTPYVVLRAGPLVRVGFDQESVEHRGRALAPRGYAGGVTLYLLLTERGWVIVGRNHWVT